MHPPVTNIEYVIRLAGTSDLAVLKEALTRNGQYANIVMNETTLYYLAELAGSGVIGLTGAEISADTALIRSTAVLTPYRGKGIAGKLVERLLESLKERGIQKLYLFSRDTGAFWKGFGFTGCTVEEVIRDAPGAYQVVSYIKDNSIWTDVAWYRPMEFG